MMDAVCAGKALSTKKGPVADVMARLQLPGMRGQLQAQFEVHLNTLRINEIPTVNEPSESEHFTGIIIFATGANVE